LSRSCLHHRLSQSDLGGKAAELLGNGFRLGMVSGHDTDVGFRIIYLFLAGWPDRRVELECVVPKHDPTVRSLAYLSFAAGRFEREMADLYGIHPAGHPKLRRLVRHAHWPEAWYPMRRDAGPAPESSEFEAAGHFPFVTVDGPGVYEIPVGPVHAGLIEPGHFRFSVAGETVLRLKARLWFVHRGLEKLFEGRPADRAIGLAERVSGDTSVAPSRMLSASNCATMRTGSAPCSSNWNGCTTTSPTWARWPTTWDSGWPTRTLSASGKSCCGSTPPSPGIGCCAAPFARARSRCVHCPT
jgi:Ni,Fe-hydrogenase III component G